MVTFRFQQPSHIYQWALSILTINKSLPLFIDLFILSSIYWATDLIPPCCPQQSTVTAYWEQKSLAGTLEQNWWTAGGSVLTIVRNKNNTHIHEFYLQEPHRFSQWRAEIKHNLVPGAGRGEKSPFWISAEQNFLHSKGTTLPEPYLVGRRAMSQLQIPPSSSSHTAEGKNKKTKKLLWKLQPRNSGPIQYPRLNQGFRECFSPTPKTSPPHQQACSSAQDVDSKKDFLGELLRDNREEKNKGTRRNSSLSYLPVQPKANSLLARHTQSLMLNTHLPQFLLPNTSGPTFNKKLYGKGKSKKAYYIQTAENQR